MIKLDLGCGNRESRIRNKTIDYIGVDWGDYKQDLNWNLNTTPYLFPSDFADIIFCSHALENFVKDFDDLHRIIKEWYRITAPNGKWIIILPHWTRAYRYITHNIGFEPMFLTHFTKGKELDKYDSLDLEITSIKYNWNINLIGKGKILIPFNYLWNKILNLNFFVTEFLLCYLFGGIGEFRIEVNVKHNEQNKKNN